MKKITHDEGIKREEQESYFKSGAKIKDSKFCVKGTLNDTILRKIFREALMAERAGISSI